ncbi:MAG: Bax inhibitor-1 family protein [Muribaculaceae bacterium]
MENYNLSNQQNYTASISISQVMRRVYVKMFLALVVSAITAYICTSIPAISMALISNSFIYIGLCVAELIMVLVLTSKIAKGVNSSVATLLFYVYSILNGVTLSLILLIYTAASVVSTFAITAGVFAAMSIYGYFTDKDLSRIGSFLFMALIGLIICTVVNIFMHSSSMEWIISFAGVAIFIGLTAWDTQKIKTMIAYSSPDQTENVATLGALSLYLDFINLFIYLLRFFGNRD